MYNRDMILRAAVLIGAVGIVLSGCSERVNSHARFVDGQDLTVTAQSHVWQSGLRRPLRLAVYDEPTLLQLPVHLGRVDFTTQMVFVAATGPCTGAGCDIRIEGVHVEDGRLRPSVKMIYPPADVPRTGVALSPLHAVVIPRCDLPVEGFDGELPDNVFSRH